ncbi:MAG: hypothetical protein D6760_07455, partial [Deltaproteobacteria bacterium]
MLKSLDVIPAELLEPPPEGERAGVFAEECAQLLDQWLRRLAKRENLCRLLIGRLGDHMLCGKKYNRLGFARMADYARERLGLSARELQSLAAVARSLRELPAIAAALRDGRLSWSKARLLVTVATPETERTWIEVAESATVRALGARVSAVRAEAARVPAAQAGGDAVRADGEDARAGAEVARVPAVQIGGEAARAEGEPARAESEAAQATALQKDARSAVDNDDDDRIDGEPKLRFSLPCPHFVLGAWRVAVELAGRMSGSPLSAWQAAEAIAAEGLAGAPLSGLQSTERRAVGRLVRIVEKTGSPQWHVEPDAAPDPFNAIAFAEHPAVAPIASRAFPWLDWQTVPDLLPDPIEKLASSADRLDPFQLDARLVAARRAMQRIDYQLGRLLRIFAARRSYQAMGFRTLGAYATERLGFSSRKASLLVTIERHSWYSSTTLTDALRSGLITPLKAAALLPIIAETNAEAWVERACQVTLRRLLDEVRWALDKRDFEGSFIPVQPPPAGMPLADLQESLRKALAVVRSRQRGNESQMCAGPVESCSARADNDSQMCAGSAEPDSAQAAEHSQMCAHPFGLPSGPPNGDSQMCAHPFGLSPGGRDDDTQMCAYQPQETEPIVSSLIRFVGPRSVVLL